MTNFAETKNLFHLPEGVIYLDGNSLGPMPISAMNRAENVIKNEWSEMLIKAWNKADWMTLPRRVGDKLATLIGAPEGSVATGDTLSIKVFQAVSAALKLNPSRKVVLSDSGNFPTDLYMVSGLISHLGPDYELRIVAPDEVENAIDETISVVMLTEVDYRTGRRHDMMKITEKTHQMGAISVWDLAHSAGALPVEMEKSNAEFAVGCTYKYINGGPGSPAFIYVRPDVADKIEPILSGWLGHEAPFAFDLDYRPHKGSERMRVGTPPIIQLSLLDEALKVWEGVDMQDVRARSIQLCEQFIQGIEKACPEFQLLSPRDANSRGSQVSFAFEHSYPAMQAMIDKNVIGDFRAPDAMRFGFTPLYIDQEDVAKAIEIIANIIKTKTYLEPKYQVRSIVT